MSFVELIAVFWACLACMSLNSPRDQQTITHLIHSCRTSAVRFVDSRVSNWCDSSEHGVNARQRGMQATAYKRGRIT